MVVGQDGLSRRKVMVVFFIGGVTFMEVLMNWARDSVVAVHLSHLPDLGLCSRFRHCGLSDEQGRTISLLQQRNWSMATL